MERRRFRNRSLGLASYIALSSSACTAVLGNKEEAAADESSLTEDPSSEAAADEIALIDAELQQENPELFQLALKYFPHDDPGGPRARLYRLTRSQLDSTLSHVLPGVSTESAVDLMPPDPLIRNYELANDLGINAANFAPYSDWAESTVEQVRTTPALVLDCSGSVSLSECQGDGVERFVREAFRGVVSEELLERYVSFFFAQLELQGEAEASAALVDVVLSSPHFSFREEVFTDASRQLLAAQALQNLSYALADVPPGALGLDESQPEEYVGTSELVAETVESILGTPEARAKMLRFFLAWLEVGEADEMDISTHVFPEFTPQVAQAMVEETRRFLQDQLSGAAPTLKNVTDSNQSFVSEELAELYGLTAGGEGVQLDPAQRRGLFTQPAFLASHSGPTDTRLVRRGVFFTRKVMCQDLGDPPEGAIPSGPLPGETERERVEAATAPPSCAGCHSYINPFGFMLENYDPMGRWRDVDEEGHSINAVIDVDFLDEGPFTAETPTQGLERFTDSAMFRQCFIQQLFTFYSGRRKSESDDPILREMFFRFSQDDNQQIFQALSVLANSFNFNRRVEAL